MKYAALLFFSAAVALSGCSLELEVPDPAEPRQIVVLAFVECRDTASQALVERTFGFNDPYPTTDPSFRGRARVALSRQGRVLSEFQHVPESNYYRGRHAAIGLDSGIVLSVEHPQFGLVEASQEPPATAELLSARLLRDVALPGGEKLSRALEVRLRDEAGRENYYELTLHGGDSLVEGNVFLFNLAQARAGNEQREIRSFLSLYDGSRLFTDEGLDGAEISLLFGLGDEADDWPAPALAVRFTTESYYRYREYTASTQSDGFSPAAANQEPFTNFSGGGLGVFALYVEERAPVER